MEIVCAFFLVSLAPHRTKKKVFKFFFNKYHKTSTLQYSENKTKEHILFSSSLEATNNYIY